MAQMKAVTTQEKAVIKWKDEPITITFHDVKTLICPYASDQETAVFLKTCQSLQLNPFAKEIYLIKYGERDKAAMVIAIDSYLKSAETNDNFNGFEAGIVLKDSGGKLELREGSLLLPDEAEKLVGGYARVYRKDREKPFYMSVNKAECVRFTREGKLTQFWTKDKQPMMLRKTALKRALVEAFPSLFAGTMSNVEADYEVMPEEVKEAVPKPRGETPEGELPPAYERNGEAYWKLWWARQKEKGLSEDDVHNMLGISSLKTDWIEQGRTLEEAENIINGALEQSVATPTKIKPKQADWRAFWEHADQLGLSHKQVCEMLGVGSVVEWTDQGKTLDEAIEVVSKKLSKPKAKRAKPAKAQPAPVIDVTPEPAEDLFTPDEVTPEPAESPPQPKRDPETIRTINELYKACHEDWNMQPKDVLKELGVSSQSDLSDTPANLYRQIATVR